MSVRIVVIGAGTPFVAGLITALAAGECGRHDLVLHGINAVCLAVVETYARSVLGPLGWQVSAVYDLATALEGAEIVIHQPRYGGGSARAKDEELAERAGTLADETLGPGGTQAALRLVPHLRSFVNVIRSVAPQAWVVNMVNPLSVSCSLLVEFGIQRVVGVCELPQFTAVQFLKSCGQDHHDFTWHVSGLNHRSFIHSLRRNGQDVAFDEIACHDSKRELGGIHYRDVARWNVLPTKYFRFFHGSSDGGYGRAAVVASIKHSATLEFQACPERFPPSLYIRPTPWYSDAVVPLLNILTGRTQGSVVATVVDADGIARERYVRLASGRFAPTECPQPPSFAVQWIARFEQHETLLLEACRTGQVSDIINALSHDLLTPAANIRRTAEAIRDHCLC